jgi:hypothetical protein
MAHVIGRASHDLHATAIVSVSVTVSVPVSVIISVSIPVAISAISVSAAPANLEIGAAPAIHPYALWVISPRLAVVACSAAALEGELHSPSGVGWTFVASAVIGGAVHAVAVVRAGRVEVTHLEVGAAAAIHPNAPVIGIAPRLVKNARRVAALLDKLNASADIGGAELPLHVIRRARDDLRLLGKGGRRRICRVTNSQRNREQRNKAQEVWSFHQSLPAA